MRELRICPVTGRIVLINEGWWAPPPPVHPAADPCPTCSLSGRPIANAEGLRVYPHPNPALGIEGDPRPQQEAGQVRVEAVGAHELIFGTHGGINHAAALRLGIQRIQDLRRDRRLRGFRLACRLIPGHHPVWQLWAFPFELRSSAPATWRDHQLEVPKNVIFRKDGVVVVPAWAPRTPFELWLLREGGRTAFEQDDPTEIGRTLNRLIPGLLARLGKVSIDLVLEEGEPWRIELLPALGKESLLEAATSIPVHGTSPEQARQFLSGLLTDPD